MFATAKRAWSLRAVLKDGHIVVSQAANDGPHIWIDSVVASAFFMSDRLDRALKKAKAARVSFCTGAGCSGRGRPHDRQSEPRGDCRNEACGLSPAGRAQPDNPAFLLLFEI
jgi:hypothetical protein